MTYFIMLKVIDANDFESEVVGDGKERSCDTLIICILTSLYNGIRNGGGIGDVLRKPSISVSFLIIL